MLSPIIEGGDLSGNQCDFTLRHYRFILEQAQDMGFYFLCLRDAGLLGTERKQIILRHDIDFSVADALQMASLEAEMGISSSYTVLLHSPTYSVGEETTLCALRQILDWGHEIALHYDGSYFESAGLAPLDGIKMEADYLGGILRTKILSVAQHRPAALGWVSAAKSGFIDAYDPRLIKDIKYLSDSRRSWREGCVHEHLASVERMQLLIHPEWWEAEAPRERRGTIARLVTFRHAEISSVMEEYASSMEK